ncbi:DUF1015 domain-containing protein [Treponema denticola]|uniref:DUF1015 domain-containing protein n=1 Tax=Treponema denticola TaxID=158 RepID=UPI0020A2B19A|nr:DUF1015 domain-containing protein [Treponema denticola]UTC83917.1 DUF1015 domain-containing protein [Treponema denticola]
MFEKYAIKIPNILLPNNTINMETWSVIACDQYTQDHDYWKKVSLITKDQKSTLNLIFPEIYLNNFSEKQKQEYILKIHKDMLNYLETGIFNYIKNSMIYVERKTEYNHLRKGLITCIDLENYDWRASSRTMIRATEETILERIPARVDIRRSAPIETPHIMLLLNDHNNRLIEGIGDYLYKNKIDPIYDFNLMMNSGKITGWTVNEGALYSHIEKELECIYDENKDEKGISFMFAVGDGNHSLATAKAVWDEYKKKFGGISYDDKSISVPENIKNHPLRYALVEIVNLYDKDLIFEPIHRVIFDADIDELVNFVQSKLSGRIIRCNTKRELIDMVNLSKNCFGFISKDNNFICLQSDIECLAVTAIQPVLDEFISSANKIDYIHGCEETFQLAEQENAVSILLPPISKDNVFSTIAKYGPLPRKSFSIGEADEKRFYLECRKLF